MVSSIILNEILKVVFIRRDTNQLRLRCQVYGLTSHVPEKVLFEEEPGSGTFFDPEYDKRFKINGEIVVPC